MHLDPVGEWNPVLDPGNGLGPVSGPHLLDPDGQHQAAVGPSGQGGHVESRGPTGAGVVDIDDAGIAQPRPLRKDCPRMQPWSRSRPAVALPNTTRLMEAGSTPASATASATTWWDMSSMDRSRRFIGVMAMPAMCAKRSMGVLLS